MSHRSRRRSLDLFMVRLVLRISGYAMLLGALFAIVMLALTRVLHLTSSELADLLLGLFY
jgi:hypothetical protein